MKQVLHLELHIFVTLTVMLIGRGGLRLRLLANLYCAIIGISFDQVLICFRLSLLRREVEKKSPRTTLISSLIYDKVTGIHFLWLLRALVVLATSHI